MRPEALEALAGSSLILHAGDVGKPEVLARLREIAPVVAVRGNVDTAPWTTMLPETESVDVGGVRIFMVHDLAAMAADATAAGMAVVISGHTHRAVTNTREGVLFLNPGSAGPRRFRLPLTVARLTIAGARVSPAIIELHVQS